MARYEPKSLLIRRSALKWEERPAFFGKQSLKWKDADALVSVSLSFFAG
ncbi:hypothetical protein [Sediminibacillus halophilus]|uniref:Uncharacterized protein n=1 Tax=Sediminibacillus halophilus TaxID=482461 RepID=A0A1G9W6Z2_9BACI|nr:hypothetical protein [Sediminibacillus halophilus]SDM79996.1 hypothetical protein SAMN05216244_3443 [Sediminibacillus halophilus]